MAKKPLEAMSSFCYFEANLIKCESIGSIYRQKGHPSTLHQNACQRIAF